MQRRSHSGHIIILSLLPSVFLLENRWQRSSWARSKWLTQPCKVMRCIKHKFLLYFSSESVLFIDWAHLATCHNIRKSETKLMFKAFSLTYKCRERVGPGPPPPVLSMNLLLLGAQPIPVLFTFPPDSLSSDDTQTQTGILRAGRLVQGSHRGNHAYISCCLFQRWAMMHSQTMNLSQAFSLRQEIEEKETAF